MTINEIHVELCGLLPNFDKASVVGIDPRCFSLVQTLNEKRSIYIHPPDNKIHHDSSGDTRCVLMNIELENSYSAEKMFDFPTQPPTDSACALNNLVNSIFVADNPFDRMSISYQIAKEMISSATEKRKPSLTSLSAVVGYIKQNYPNKITISDLAEMVGWSESNLYAAFKKQYGVSPIAYLNDYRLECGSKLLSTTNLPVELVARAVGIDDFRYFSKIFKRKYNQTPTQYRKSNLTR